MSSWKCTVCRMEYTNNFPPEFKYGETLLCSGCDNRGRVWAAKTAEWPPGTTLGAVLFVVSMILAVVTLFATEYVQAVVRFLLSPWAGGE